MGDRGGTAHHQLFNQRFGLNSITFNTLCICSVLVALLILRSLVSSSTSSDNGESKERRRTQLNVAAADWDATSVPRLLFIGDSITEGIGVRHPSSRGIPVSGLCSYRFALMRLLERELQASVGGSAGFVTVGPFHGTAGSQTVPDKCRGVKSSRIATAASHHFFVNSSSRDFTAHAAVWGGLLEEILDPRGTLPYDRQRSNSRRLAKMPHPELDGSARESGAPALAQWMRRYAPDVVLFLLGTNDLSRGITPEQLLRRLASALTIMLSDWMLTDVAARESAARSSGGPPAVVKGLQCRRTIVVSTLLDRDGVRRGDVAAFNDLLLREAGGAGDAILDLLRVFRHPCVKVVSGGRGFDHAVHTCDGIHPNEAGEEIVAANLVSALADALRGVS